MTRSVSKKKKKVHGSLKRRGQAQSDGYDISPDQFPDRKRLPDNVSLSNLDALGPIPEELVGRYDVMHISLFVMLVRNEDPGPVLESLMRMLSEYSFLYTR